MLVPDFHPTRSRVLQHLKGWTETVLQLLVALAGWGIWVFILQTVEQFKVSFQRRLTKPFMQIRA